MTNPYQALFPEPEYYIDEPFRTEYPDISEDEIEALKMQEPMPSIMFHCPVARPGVEWMGLYALDPTGGDICPHRVRHLIG